MSVTLVAGVLAGMVSAADFFVSKSGTWKPAGKTEGTCYTDLVAAVAAAGSGGTICVSTDPHLTGDGHLARGNPCGNAARVYDWMRDPGDVRSRDLDGLPRIGGKGPDMGCYERQTRGLVLTLK